MSETVQFIQTTPEQLGDLIATKVDARLSEVKELIQNKGRQRYMNRQETAKYLGVTLGTLNNWRKSGTLEPKYIGGRVFYKAEDIDRVLDK